MKGADLRLLDEIRELAGQVTRIRGEEFKPAPIAVRGTAAERRTVIELKSAIRMSEEQAQARGRSWADLGLGSVETPARLIRSVEADLPGVTLTPDDGRLLVDPEILPPGGFLSIDEETPAQTLLLATGVRPDEPLLAHYLIHSLVRADETEIGTTDAWLAGRAAREGEATLVAIRLLFDPLGLDAKKVELDPGLVLDGRLIPAGFDSPTVLEQRVLDFVHGDGYVWARNRFAAHGWQGLRELPQTTGTILEPAKAGAQPKDLDTVVGPVGRRVLDRDRLGSFGIFLWLSVTTGKDSLALLSAEGWQGGALERLDSESGELTRWITDWSDAKHAEQFRYTIGRSFGARFPDANIEGEKTGWSRLPIGDRRAVWRRVNDRVELWIGPPAAVEKIVSG